MKPSTLPELISSIKRLEPDIIHLFGGSAATIVGFLITKLTGRPVIQTVINVHPRYYTFPFYRIRKSIPAHIRFAGVKSLAGVICHSKYVADFLVKIGYPENKITMTHPGIFFNEPVVNEKNQKSLDFGENVVLFWTGANDKERGFDTFLASIPLVLQKIPTAQFYAAVLNFINQKTRANAIEVARKTEVLHIIESLTGKYRLPNCQEELVIDDLIGASCVVVLPNKINPQEPPFSLLQSMALGKAVVTTRLGANEEVIKNHNNGVLVGVNNSAALAEAIITLLNDKSRTQAIAITAGKYVTENYSWETYIQANMEVYKRLIK